VRARKDKSKRYRFSNGVETEFETEFEIISVYIRILIVIPRNK